MIRKIGVDKNKTPAYLNTETGLVSFGCRTVKTLDKEDLPVTKLGSENKDLYIMKNDPRILRKVKQTCEIAGFPETSLKIIYQDNDILVVTN